MTDYDRNFEVEGEEYSTHKHEIVDDEVARDEGGIKEGLSGNGDKDGREDGVMDGESKLAISGVDEDRKDGAQSDKMGDAEFKNGEGRNDEFEKCELQKEKFHEDAPLNDESRGSEAHLDKPEQNESCKDEHREPLSEGQESTVVTPPRDPVIYGAPGENFLSDQGVQVMLDVTHILEVAGITCFLVDTSALIYFGARRMRGDWQICVPTNKLDTAASILKSGPHSGKYLPSKYGPPTPAPRSLRHKYPRFKLSGYLLWFLLVPAEDCHMECSPSNIERSPKGLPFPKLEIFAQSLIDTANANDLSDLIDGMNLTEAWGNEHLDLEGMSDTEWARQRNILIAADAPETLVPRLYEISVEPVDKRQLWESRVRKKEHRLGIKYPKKIYATRFRTHKSRDPRLRGRT